MAANPDLLKRDTGHPCLACGNYTYVEANLIGHQDAVKLIRTERTVSEKFQGKGKCGVKVRVCRKCGFVVLHADDIGGLLNDPTIGGAPPKA